ncbi:hypothetical protein BDN71DRAFT_1434574 [Pleurotus eryngii]|uniref:Uncharacterized protein n=1 Tax=Pleurotus eryngii TaxID=5323 RepID=A0A9P5ZRS0_PLEER|nr:hypothetical protein BDN71DRAFT_1434574 [Pleurotus eryngii]
MYNLLKTHLIPINLDYSTFGILPLLGPSGNTRISYTSWWLADANTRPTSIKQFLIHRLQSLHNISSSVLPPSHPSDHENAHEWCEEKCAAFQYKYGIRFSLSQPSSWTRVDLIIVLVYANEVERCVVSNCPASRGWGDGELNGGAVIQSDSSSVCHNLSESHCGPPPFNLHPKNMARSHGLSGTNDLAPTSWILTSHISWRGCKTLKKAMAQQRQCDRDTCTFSQPTKDKVHASAVLHQASLRSNGLPATSDGYACRNMHWPSSKASQNWMADKPLKEGFSLLKWDGITMASKLKGFNLKGEDCNHRWKWSDKALEAFVR